MSEKIKKILMGVAALAALALGGSALAGAASGGKDTAAQEGSEAVEGPERNESSETEEPENSAADPDDVQEENGEDDADEPVTGEAATRARQAAASETGGKPGDVERDEEEGTTYEVEVTQGAGKHVEVYLDDQYKVVAVDEEEDENED